MYRFPLFPSLVSPVDDWPEITPVSVHQIGRPVKEIPPPPALASVVRRRLHNHQAHVCAFHWICSQIRVVLPFCLCSLFSLSIPGPFSPIPLLLSSSPFSSLYPPIAHFSPLLASLLLVVPGRKTGSRSLVRFRPKKQEREREKRETKGEERRGFVPR